MICCKCGYEPDGLKYAGRCPKCGGVLKVYDTE